MTTAGVELAALPAGDIQRTGRVTQRRVLWSEWLKLWSVRSTRWSLAVGVLALLLGIANSAFDMSRWYSLPLHVRLHYKSIDNSLIGWHFSQLAIGVLGVLVVTGEYATGMIRSTFMAVPTRLPVLWAKVLVFALVVLALSIPATLVDFVISASILTQHHVNPSLSTPHALRAVLGIPLFLCALAVFTVALGALLRNTAAGIAAFAGILFVLPGFVGVLSTNLQNAIGPYLPSNAASALFTATPNPENHWLHPWVGFAVFCGYALLLLLVAAILLLRRDV
jgi:ABC-type transport system involved in multi-copper enzyme maturation permease subunit